MQFFFRKKKRSTSQIAVMTFGRVMIHNILDFNFLLQAKYLTFLTYIKYKEIPYITRSISTQDKTKKNTQKLSSCEIILVQYRLT